MGTTHLTYLPLREHTRGIRTRLSSVSRFRRRSEEAYPFRTLTLFRIAVGRHPHTLFVQRGSDYTILSLLKDTSKGEECQWVLQSP